MKVPAASVMAELPGGCSARRFVSAFARQARQNGFVSAGASVTNDLTTKMFTEGHRRNLILFGIS
jgi:hypothetical protein